ncbi:hypothetical protein MU582_09975 [Nocardioidaceae bacterium SCSIO 66511]|nr:hypothetical protein MU582_09975 [Nocardioidaceae bacterium SCSIO 66511]
MRLTDSTGTRWRVKRRWVPWRRRVRDFGYDIPYVSGMGDDPISMVLGVIAFIIAIPLLVLAFVAMLELLVLLLLVPIAMLIRALFGGAWPIEVFCDGKLQGTEYVKGWRASRERMRAIMAQLRHRGGVREGA